MPKRTERTRTGGTHHVTPKRRARTAPTESTEEKRDADQSSDHRGEG
jgi:hypothetical protein